jgi:hypothetical protein
MRTAQITRQDFLRDRQGREYSDVLEDPALPFDTILEFFNRRDHQHQMEESESLYKKAPVAAIVRELEAMPAVQGYMSATDPQRKKRFEQSLTILVRMIMERLGWQVIPQTMPKR